MSGDSEYDLCDDVGKVQSDPDRKGPTEVCGRVAVAMATVGMAVVVMFEIVWHRLFG